MFCCCDFILFFFLISLAHRSSRSLDGASRNFGKRLEVGGYFEKIL